MDNEKRERSFPEETEERLEYLVKSLNSEGKCLSILHLGEDPCGPFVLRKRVIETLGDDGLVPKKSSFKSYCLDGFFPTGLAYQIETFGKNKSITGYMLTSAGKSFGQPIAAFLLNYAVENGLSLIDILGTSPIPRLKVLNILRENRKADRVKLLETAGIQHPSLLNHLKDLSKIGFLTYDSVGAHGRGNFVYVPTGKDPSSIVVHGMARSVMKEAAEKLCELREADYATLSNLLGYKNPSEFSPILRALKEQGFVKEKKWVRREYESEAEILPPAIDFMAAIDEVKYALEDKKKLEDMQKFSRKLTGNIGNFRSVAQKGMQLHLVASGGCQKESLEDWAKKVHKYLLEHPGSRPYEIAKVLGTKSVLKYLSHLIEQGKARKEEESIVKVRYYPFK